MAFLAEHVKKLTDDLRTSAEARAATLSGIRNQVIQMRTSARAFVTASRQAAAATADRQRVVRAAGRTERTRTVRGLLGSFARIRAERRSALREQQTAARAGRAAAVAALRQRAREVREEFANDRQLAAKVWRSLRTTARRSGA